MTDKKFMVEILEDYYESNDQSEKEELIKYFIDSLWESKYKYQTVTRHIKFTINKNITDKQAITLFSKYNDIEIKLCKSFHHNIREMDSFDLLRTHVNNLYAFLCKNDIYLPKKYYELLKTAKNRYYDFIHGEKLDLIAVEQEIRSNMEQATNIRQQYNENKKMMLTWSQFKKIIESFIRRLFKNYLPSYEYEKEHGWNFDNPYIITPDNYTIQYFTKSLTGYIRNYSRDSKVEDKHCVTCGKSIGRRGKYCEECYRIHRRNYKTAKQREYRHVDN